VERGGNDEVQNYSRDESCQSTGSPHGIPVLHDSARACVEPVGCLQPRCATDELDKLWSVEYDFIIVEWRGLDLGHKVLQVFADPSELKGSTGGGRTVYVGGHGFPLFLASAGETEAIQNSRIKFFESGQYEDRGQHVVCSCPPPPLLNPQTRSRRTCC
jgi:hypothetical protein